MTPTAAEPRCLTSRQLVERGWARVERHGAMYLCDPHGQLYAHGRSTDIGAIRVCPKTGPVYWIRPAWRDARSMLLFSQPRLV